eukprot:1160273-Pelagomonas_calceolata.AAC.10
MSGRQKLTHALNAGLFVTACYCRGGVQVPTSCAACGRHLPSPCGFPMLHRVWPGGHMLLYAHACCACTQCSLADERQKCSPALASREPRGELHLAHPAKRSQSTRLRC